MEDLNGWQNIGVMYKYGLSLKMKPVDFSIYMLIVNYSFGYREPDATISIKQFCEELSVTDKTISLAIKRLLDSGSVTRIEWQQVGPKQIYKYRIKFPPQKFGFISLKKNQKSKKDKELNEADKQFHSSL